MNDHRVAALRALARNALGGPVELVQPALARATGTVVRMRCVSTEVIGKLHRSRSLHEREVHAYREWAPHLGTAVPQLLGVDKDVPGILVTAVPGAPLDELSLDPATEQVAHEQAGRLLRRLHALPVTTPATEIIHYLTERAEHWITQVSKQLTSHDVDLVRSHMRRLGELPAPRVAACHLDFQPRNLLRHTDSHIRLIDFEHSREDLAARDLTRLATRYWPHRPDLKTAFLHGYGQLDNNDTAVLEHATALEALTSLAHGLRTNDPDYLHHGHTLLTRLRSP